VSAIRVRGLSKEYAIGRAAAAPQTIREALGAAFRSPLRRLRRLGGDVPPADRFLALDAVDFDVEAGEVAGIIGRNGAGKSTLLKILSGITDPTAGRVELHGRTGSLLEVGTGFHPELSGRENIFLNGALLGMRNAEIRRKFDAIVAFSEVERFIDTPVKHYSSGMYVRLAFSVAAHLEPEILIVDEVLAVGDARFQKKCLGRIGEIGREGRTVLIVSHNMQVVQAMCGRALWIEGGKIAFDGEARAAVAAYTRSCSSGTPSAEWPDAASAPGNDHIRLRAVRVAADGGGGALTVRTPFRVEIDWELLLPEADFFLGFHLRTASGEIVFVTASPPAPLRRGAHRSVCRVPGDLLNDGAYTLDLYFVRDGSALLFKAESPVAFDVADSGRDPGGFLGKWPGAVRPRLDWESEAPR
jgi:lipopolysaccharide transport system ATP-binding protein